MATNTPPLIDLARRHWGKLLLLVLLASAIVAAPFVMEPGHEAAPAAYHCPMHPAFTSDRPGDCPICGMRLVPTASATKASEAAGAGPELYACPMHPEVHQDGPGKCPKCGMDLVKQEAPPATAVLYVCPMHPEVQQDHPGSCPKCGMDLVKKDAATPGGGIEGLAAVHADADRAALAGIRTVEAVEGTIISTVRAVGSVAADEARVRQVTTKIGGWIEKLSVNTVGQFVRAGDPLFDLYSPELLVSQEEYLRSRRTAAEFALSSLPEVRRGGQDLAAAARQRLELFDVPQAFLERIELAGAAQRTVTFPSPYGGYVTEKMVQEGQRIDPGMPLLTLTDLSTVWVIADLYETEAAAAVAGRPATLSLQFDPGQQHRARVSLVYPTMNVESRTIRVRFEAPNPRLALKPGMFVNVELEARRVSGIVIPDSALIDTGTRQVVFVEESAGHFEPREVVAGQRTDGRVIVSSGLAAGERVAVAATFLLDSESRLRSALGGAKAPDHSQHK